MKLLIVLGIAVLAPTLAQAGDIMSVIRRLESAEGQIASAQQTISAAQQQITYAKQELYALLQNPGPGTVCVYNYFGRQYHGRGANEQEATENAIFQCSNDRGNPTPGDCRYWSNKNGNIQCRATNH